MRTNGLDTQDAVTQLARARDVDGLRRLADGLGSGPAVAYERARALALALAIEGNLDAALAELGLGNAASLAGASRHSVDVAHVLLLAGDAAGAVTVLAARAQNGGG